MGKKAKEDSVVVHFVIRLEDLIAEIGLFRDALDHGVGAREVALAVTNIQQGVFWLIEADWRLENKDNLEPECVEL